MSDLSNALLDFDIRYSTDGGLTYIKSDTYDLHFQLTPNGYTNYTIANNDEFNNIVSNFVELVTIPNLSQYILYQLNSNYTGTTILHQLSCTLENKLIKIRLRTPS